MRTKERQDALVTALKAWQRIETRSMAQSAAIVEKTRNPVIRMVMEIIQHDSSLHHQVQQFIIDSLETRAVSLTVEDLEHVWTSLEAHIEAERRTGEFVAAARRALAGTRSPVQQLLLSYLANDEEKHDALLEDLALLKQGMYRSA
jgi:predicted MarR family transcription regulator